MTEIEQTVQATIAKMRERNVPSTMVNVEKGLKKLLSLAVERGIETPCQELFDAFAAQYSRDRWRVNYCRWILRQVDAEADLHLLSDPDTFYNDLPFPDEESVSLEFQSAGHPLRNIDLRHVIVKAMMELRNYQLTESTLGQYMNVWKTALCRRYQEGSLSYDKEFLLRFIGEKEAEYQSGTLALWKFKIYRRAMEVLISVAETGVYHWSHHIRKRRCDGDDLEGVRQQYGEHLRSQNLAENTIQMRLHVFRRMMSYANIASCEELAQMRPEHVETALHLYSTGYSPRSMAVTQQIIRDILEYLYRNGYVKERLSGIVMTTCSVKDHVAAYISKDEEARLIAGLERETRRRKAVVLLAYRLGLRGCDICNLQFQNIDWKEEKIRIYQKKTGKFLSLPLLTDVGNAIFEYVTEERPKGAKGIPYVFVSVHAPYRKLRDVYQDCRRVVRGLNLTLINGEACGPYIFRYSLVHRLLEAKVPHQVITDTLGHASRNADKPYISMDDEFLKDCALDLSLIGKVLWKEPPHDCV